MGAIPQSAPDILGSDDLRTTVETRGEMTTRWARFARGWLAALFSTLVAAGSHTLAGGQSPSHVSLVLALAFGGITCVALTGKTISPLRLTAAVTLSQLAFHSMFSTIGTPTALVPSDGAGVHQHGASAHLLPGATPVGEQAMHHQDAWMWLGHAVAAAITIVALRYGEAAFWRMRGIAMLLVRTVLAIVPAVPLLPRATRRAVVAGHLFVPRCIEFLRLSLGLRGPPVSFA